MTADTIDHSMLTRLVKDGALPSARAVGQSGGWIVRIAYGSAERSLSAQRSKQVRVFRRIETLVSYLNAIGISRFEVDAAGYRSGRDGEGRPDRAEALRRVHEAAAYDQWFRTQVDAAVTEADSPAADWLSHEQAEDDWRTRRAVYQTRLSSRSGA